MRIEELRAVLDNVGRTDAPIEREDDRNYVIELPDLRPQERDADGNVIATAERDDIQQALEEAFPAVRMSLTFTDGVDADTVSAAVGREDATVIRRSDTSFIVEFAIPGPGRARFSPGVSADFSSPP